MTTKENSLIEDLKKMTPLEALEMLSKEFFDSNHPINYLILCPKEDMEYCVGDLIRDIIKREKGE